MDNLPEEVVNKLNEFDPGGKNYAAFDLDNTLLIDDIGEAVFGKLLKMKLVNNFSWKDYLDLMEVNRKAAYKKTIDVMNGLKLNVLKSITNEMLDSEEQFIEIGNDKIPVPRPNPVMQSIVSLLKTRGVDVYVVTASNCVSAEIICRKYFGIPSNNVIGAPVVTDSGNVIIGNAFDIPYAEGKVYALKKRFKNKPIVTGGDGEWDKFLLDYTAEGGIRLWLGKNKQQFQWMKENFYRDGNFYHIAGV